jgi:hypothetical protein
MIDNGDDTVTLTYDELATRLANAHKIGKASATSGGSSKLLNDLPAAMDSAMFPNAERLGSVRPGQRGKQSRAERFPNGGRLA